MRISLEIGQDARFELDLSAYYRKPADRSRHTMRHIRNSLIRTEFESLNEKIVGRLTMWSLLNLLESRNMRRIKYTHDGLFEDIVPSEQIFHNLPDWATNTVYLGGLAVLPQYRRKGVATGLIDRVINDEALDSKRVVATSSSEETVSIFEGRGFRKASPSDYLYFSYDRVDRDPTKVWTDIKKLSQRYQLEDCHTGSSELCELSSIDSRVSFALNDDTNLAWWGMQESALDRPYNQLMFAGQAVAFVNPEYSREQVCSVIPDILDEIGGSQWVEIFQLKDSSGEGTNVCSQFDFSSYRFIPPRTNVLLCGNA